MYSHNYIVCKNALNYLVNTVSILSIKCDKWREFMSQWGNHDLIATFTELKGNPKMSIITEPLWFIPYSLFAPFATLYMAELGLNGQQIGLIISIGLILQIVFSLLGGIITDKLGRRKTTFIFDFISWSIPCFVWAFAQNFYWFLAAAIINAAYQITNASWNCLFVEDCPPKHLTNAFTLIQICGMLSVFASPIAIHFVDVYSVISVVRVLYFISGVSMSMKFLLLYIYGGETKVGEKRIQDTKNISYFTLFKGYKDVFKIILKSKEMVFVVVFMALTNIIGICTNSFFSLYITKHLSLSEELVAVFPMVRTLIMLVFVIALQNVFNRLKMKRSLLIGFVLYILSHVLLLASPKENLLFVMLYTVLEAGAYAIIFPRKDALMAFYVLLEERSRIFALFNTGMIAISSPFGYIIGLLFTINPRYPFILNIVIFLICILLVLLVKAVRVYDKKANNV